MGLGWYWLLWAPIGLGLIGAVAQLVYDGWRDWQRKRRGDL